MSDEWLAGFYDADRQLMGSADSLPFTIPEGTRWLLVRHAPDFVHVYPVTGKEVVTHGTI